MPAFLEKPEATDCRITLNGVVPSAWPGNSFAAQNPFARLPGSGCLLNEFR